MSDNATRLLTAAAATAPLPDHLRDRLLADARAERLLDVGYRTVDSPLGRLLVAGTEAGVVRLAFEREDHDHVVDALAERVGARVLHDPKGLDEVARELDAYFGGARRSFDVALDLRLSRGFRLEVLRHLRDIPFGRTESYTEVAEATHHPRAVRAVGSACATNPVPIIVPCHRVLRSDGGLGGYLGGADAKRWLLAHETAA